MGPGISQSGVYRSVIPATRGAQPGLSQVQDPFGIQSELKASLNNLGEILNQKIKIKGEGKDGFVVKCSGPHA